MSICPKAKITDITHNIPAHDINAGGFAIAASYKYFPKDTVHVVVVDPGVGTRRRIIAVRHNGHYFVAPDNGVLTYVLKEKSRSSSYVLNKRKYFLKDVSDTFHGRDIMAPVAAYICKGTKVCELGSKICDIKLLDTKGNKGRVIYVDKFGNLITNIRIRKYGMQNILVGNKKVIKGINSSYESGRKDKPMAIVGSAGYLEISIKNGSAAKRFNWGLGTRVEVL